MKKALAIDIGGTKISWAKIDEEGKILNEVEKIKTPKSSDEIQAVLKEIMKKNLADVEVIKILILLLFQIKKFLLKMTQIVPLGQNIKSALQKVILIQLR